LPQGQHALRSVASTALARYFVGEAGTWRLLASTPPAYRTSPGMRVEDFGGWGRSAARLREASLRRSPTAGAVSRRRRPGYVGSGTTSASHERFGAFRPAVSTNAFTNVTYRAARVVLGGAGQEYRGGGPQRHPACVVHTRRRHAHGARAPPARAPPATLAAVRWGTSYAGPVGGGPGSARCLSTATPPAPGPRSPAPRASLLHSSARLRGCPSPCGARAPATFFVSRPVHRLRKPPIPGVYRVARARPGCLRAYPDPDYHPPSGLTDLSNRRGRSGWATFNGSGQAWR
jgi:hypothetical protein